MRNVIVVCGIVLSISCLACAGAEFVGIDALDEVYENYRREGSGLWPEPENGAAAKLSGGATVSACTEGAACGEGPEMAFDGTAKTKYCTLAPTMWIQHQSAKGTTKHVVAYALTTANDHPLRDPCTWTLRGSTDGKQWDVLDQRKDEEFSQRFQRRQFEVSKPGDYAWYKLDVTKNWGTHTTQLSELELLTAEELKAVAKNPAAVGAAGWEPLFAPDLSNAEFPAGVWTVSNGEITASQDKLIMTKKEYENFVLDLEFKNGPAANSGVFVYLTDPAGWVRNSVEIQITDDESEKWAKANPTWKCGAIFGRLAPCESAVKPAGEWNRYTIICKGPRIDVILNGEHVNSMDMLKWDSATHNPDGTKKPGWLSKPLNNHPTKGRIGFQGKHGGAPIWFRNLKIKPLD